jgi:hypothetical protein
LSEGTDAGVALGRQASFDLDELVELAPDPVHQLLSLAGLGTVRVGARVRLRGLHQGFGVVRDVRLGVPGDLVG